MGVLSFTGQRRPLTHTKPVLLVGDDKSQILKHCGFRHQCVGTHHQPSLSVLNPLPDQSFLLGCERAGEQFHGDTQWGEQFGKRCKMLLCQNFRRRHHRRLLSVLNSKIGSSRGHHRLTAAHIALHQPVHGRAATEIFRNFSNRPALGACQGKGQRLIKGSQIQIVIGRNFL